MRTLFILALLFPSASFAASSTPETCYSFFPGAKGKKCCDKSYAHAAKGAMTNSARKAQLEACTGQKAKF
jgi:hypothetical protein